MKKQAPKNFRKKFTLVHPEVQLLLLGVNFAVILTFAVIMWASIRNTLLDLKPAAGLSGMEAETFRRFIDHQATAFETTTLIVFVVGLAVSSIITLAVSHRLAGPIVRLRSYFQSIGRGEDMELPLEFRDGDYLSDLPPVVNEAMARLRANPPSESAKRRAS